MQVKGKLQQNVEAAMKRGMLFSDVAGRAGVSKFEKWVIWCVLAWWVVANNLSVVAKSRLFPVDTVMQLESWHFLYRCTQKILDILRNIDIVLHYYHTNYSFTCAENLNESAKMFQKTSKSLEKEVSHSTLLLQVPTDIQLSLSFSPYRKEEKIHCTGVCNVTLL